MSLGSPYEELIGFSRAVRLGPIIAVGGTAPLDDDGQTIGIGDPAMQTRRCFEIIGVALRGAGATWDDVIRTRTLLTRIDDYEVVAQVRREFVGHVKPVDTIVQVSRFVNPDWLVEIEVDAVAVESSLA